MTFSVKLLFLISLSLSFAAQTIAHLNLFPDNFDIDSTTDIEDKLHLFSNVSIIGILSFFSDFDL